MSFAVSWRIHTNEPSSHDDLEFLEWVKKSFEAKLLPLLRTRRWKLPDLHSPLAIIVQCNTREMDR